MSKKFSIQQEAGFYLDRHKATMPSVAGIYVVYKCNYDPFMDTVDVKEVLYIGETLNIHARHNGTSAHPSKHEQYDEFISKAGGADHVCYGVIPMEEYSEDDRKWILDTMIFFQKPLLNNGVEKSSYSYPYIDLSLNGFPYCWKSFRINIT